MKRSEIAFRETLALEDILRGSAAEQFDDANYNRPYLNVLFA